MPAGYICATVFSASAVWLFIHIQILISFYRKLKQKSGVTAYFSYVIVRYLPWPQHSACHRNLRSSYVVCRERGGRASESLARISSTLPTPWGLLCFRSSLPPIQILAHRFPCGTLLHTSMTGPSYGCLSTLCLRGSRSRSRTA